MTFLFFSEDKDVSDPHKWMGANVMGKALMEIRDLLAERREYAEEVRLFSSRNTAALVPKRAHAILNDLVSRTAQILIKPFPKISNFTG